MNNQQLYLAWLRTAAPDVYSMAMRKVFGKPRSLGGLNCDLVKSMTAPATMGSFGQDSSSDSSFIDPGAYVPPDSALPTDYTPPPLPTLTQEALTPVAPITDTTAALPTVDTTTMPAVNPSTGTSWFSSVINAVGNVASTALVASQQSSLVRLNTTRAQQGLPPVDQYGRVVQPYHLAPATGTIYRLESAISGATGGLSPILLLGGVGLLAFFFMRR